jgi:hypothetical protein
MRRISRNEWRTISLCALAGLLFCSILCAINSLPWILVPVWGVCGVGGGAMACLILRAFKSAGTLEEGANGP